MLGSALSRQSDSFCQIANQCEGSRVIGSEFSCACLRMQRRCQQSVLEPMHSAASVAGRRGRGSSSSLVLQSRLWIVSSGSIVVSFRGLLMPSAPA